jgi:hypothetical protein
LGGSGCVSTGPGIMSYEERGREGVTLTQTIPTSKTSIVYIYIYT